MWFAQFFKGAGRGFLTSLESGPPDISKAERRRRRAKGKRQKLARRVTRKHRK